MSHSDYRFPNTRWSMVLQAQGNSGEMRHQALEQICRTYWLPVYAFARSQSLAPQDAEDLTQNVFADLLRRKEFDHVAPRKGKLRSFLMVATKHYLMNEWKSDRRQKRGGGAPVFSLDCEDAERRCALDASGEETPERLFDRHWGVNLLQRTIDRLEAAYQSEGKGDLFRAIKGVLGDRVGALNYRTIGNDLGMNEGAVRVAVHRLRKRCRQIVKQEVALTLGDESDDAVEEEIRYLFGMFAS